MSDIVKDSDTETFNIQNIVPERQIVAREQNATPARLLEMAVQSGADLAKLEKLMELQERWQATEAKKKYDEAFSSFKSEAVKLVKNKTVKTGPLTNSKYAELHSIVNAVTPALSRNKLSSSWKTTIDDKDWIQVTCILRHVDGHQESVSMGAPPDTGGAKNAIQSRASTISYLERYTLKAILGLSEQDDDTDGNFDSSGADWIAKVDEAEDVDSLTRISREGTQFFKGAKDVPGYNNFVSAVQKRGAELRSRNA